MKNLPISLIIPTLNEEYNISKILRNINVLKSNEVTIVDGGSKDNTKKLLKKYRVFDCIPSRGKQLALGAKKSNEKWLLFLHADTILNNQNVLEIDNFISKNPYYKVAYFKLNFDNREVAAYLISLWANLRTLIFKLPFGDQALLISKKYYKEIGGFSLIPIMEDLEFIIRIPKKNKFLLSSSIITSFSKYKNNGVFMHSLQNITKQIKFFIR